MTGVATAADSRAGTSAWLMAAALALPLIALAVLLAVPAADVVWEHHPGHFWLVLATAGLNVALAFATNEAAHRRADARLFLVSLAFLSGAGFLALHALATPGVMLQSPNAGFVVATPVGLLVASAFSAASISPLAGPRGSAVIRHSGLIRSLLVAAMIGWGVVSLAGLPPLSGQLPPTEAAGPVGVVAVVGVALYAASAWRYADLYRRRRSVVALATAVALVLLAESMVAVALSRNWHLSWWEWHVLMTIAFAAIALGARAEYRRTGSLSAAFGGLYLEATLARVEHWHGRAIADLAGAQERGEPTDRIAADLRRDGASTDEIAVLTEAARELRRVGELFGPYLPAQLAHRLRAEPGMARLGGEEREVSVVFADLASFTTFSENRSPTEVIGMLNEYWASAVPILDGAGGVIEHFAGDGVMVIFNAVADQPDHALRAAEAGLGLVHATDPIAAAHPGWPRFRVGVNTGRAVVGNVGAAGRRSFAAIGDTANLGARLMSAGEPGEVVIGQATRDALEAHGRARSTRSLGRISVKGKREPVAAWVLEG